MLHNNVMLEDNAAATSTTTTNDTATTTTATTETLNGTEPTIATATHFMPSNALQLPIAATAAAVNAAIEETVAAVGVGPAAAAPAAAVPAAPTTSSNATAEGQALTANNIANANAKASANAVANAIRTTPSPLPAPPLPASATLALAAMPLCPELAATTAAVTSPSASPAAAVQLSHVASEPAFGIQMRTQQQQKIKCYHDAKQTALWQTDSIASSSSASSSASLAYNKCSSARMASAMKGMGMAGPSGASTSPCLMQRKCSDSSIGSATNARRVSFPENDKELVTGYLEPANPWEQACQVKSNSEISELYVNSSYKHHTKPLQNILEHLKSVDLHQVRQPLLSLKGVQLTPNDCEPLEELFKRVQYKVIDLSECPLDESCLSALCQMIEYYEATNELDISCNKAQMTFRSWMQCIHVIGRSQELQVLNAEGNQISKLGAESLGSALSTSNLHTLKLEHCGLKGPPLTSLCCKLYHNKLLKELWLGYNDLDCTDAQHIADMLRFNHSMELIDISNNNIRDEGAMYLVQALILQSTELERRSGAPLQRARAIQDDECESPLDPMPPTQLSPMQECVALPETERHLALSISAGASGDDSISSLSDVASKEATTSDSFDTSSSIELPNAATTTVNTAATALLVDLENEMDDDNTEDTVRTVRGCNTTGQSMLDKLLSMNSDSSSEEAPSNISTDTLAACCSEDISEISNDLLDPLAAKIQSAAENGTGQPIPTTAPAPTPLLLLSPTTEQQIQTLQQPQPLQQQQQSSLNERNLCDITPSTEAKTVEPNESCVQNHNNNNNNNNTNTNTNNNNHANSHNSNNNHVVAVMATATPPILPPSASNTGEVTVAAAIAVAPPPLPVAPAGATVTVGIFEVTAEESDCINGGATTGAASRPVDMNKNAKAGDDFEDTHSTDSAFESASEGDISRHLPDEFTRLSTSLESKEIAIETATIATESTECLVAEEAVTPCSTPTPVSLKFVTESTKDDDVFAPPKVTIAEECLTAAKDKELSHNPCISPSPTPPPPSTSPGGVSSGLRRSESSCAYLNQSTRNRSQSSDSLCSDNSLEGSTSTDPQLAEKLTKNDTLSRRQLVDATTEGANRLPSGLKALTLWNNNLSKDVGPSIAELLQKTVSLELLNIGKNCLSNDFVTSIKDSLTKNTTLTTLGLQSAHLSAKGIETLASILAFGGNSKLQRIDIRDNKLEVESLNIIAEVLKNNNTLTQIDINDEPKRLTLPIVPIVNVIPPTPLPQDSIGSEAHLDYTRVLGTVRSMCSRNEKKQQAERTAAVGAGSKSSNNRCRGGYYLGSRKISLTCHSRPLVDAETGTVTSALAVTALPTPAAKLEVKRKTNSRLRSPGPSPPTISPSSSPNRSRFHVSRVNEVSPLTSPLAQLPPQHPPTPTPTPRSASSCMSIPMATSPGTCSLLGSQSSLNVVAAPLPTSSSLPAMASVTSSTQTVKRLSVSPRSRFHVSRIYEDPQVPLGNRQMPPITPQTPPINLPPTPMLKSARKAAQLAEANAATTQIANTAAANSIIVSTPSTVIIVEPTGSGSAQEHQHSTNGADDSVANKLSPASSSSTCSTSPVSLTSNSNNSSSSSTSSASSAVASDSTTDSSSAPAKSCPIAVFGDNDITLTKESAAGVALSAVAAINIETEPQPAPVSAAPVEAANQQPTRARKTSWIDNPSAVDKLLTLFSTSTIFQRSSSPEKVNPANTAPTNNAQNTTSTGATEVNTQNSQLVVRKVTPPAWSLTSNNSNTNATSLENCSANSGSGPSFFDAASRQLRDFSKQVFRQNIIQESSILTTGSGTGGSSPISTDTPSTPEFSAAHIPLNLKRELKENISPEHTINEETLQSLQKLARVEDIALQAEAAAELSDIEIVMHSELDDCPSDVEQLQPQQQQQQQQQSEDKGAVNITSPSV